MIGKGIELGERILRRICGEKHLTAAGGTLWLVIAGLSSCDKTESNEDGGEQTGNTRFRVSVNDETLTAESVTV